MALIIIITLMVVLPSVLIYWLGFVKSSSIFNWIIKVLLAWAIFLFYSYALPWANLSLWIKYTLIILLITSTLWSLTKLKHVAFFEKKRILSWLKLAAQLLLLAMFSFNLNTMFKGFHPPEGISSLQLDTPLKQAYISHGGDNVLINYHNVNKTQAYALDLLAIDSFGRSTKKMRSKNLEDYNIYKDTLYSPCTCTVVEIQNNLKDVEIGDSDKENAAGNHIIFEYQNHLIVYAHINQYSIMVKEGQTVKSGQSVALVGNSGNTSEPHLHVHAVKGTNPKEILSGEGVPILFNNHFYRRNQLMNLKDFKKRNN